LRGVRVHFHSFGHVRPHEEEPPPAWVSHIPPLRHVWVGSSSIIVDLGVLAVLLLVGLWKLSGLLAAWFGRD
jgi:hypothetical protein